MLKTTCTVTALSALLLLGCSPTDAETGHGPKLSPAHRGHDRHAVSLGVLRSDAYLPQPLRWHLSGPARGRAVPDLDLPTRVTYTVPAGWTNFEDLPGNFWLFRSRTRRMARSAAATSASTRTSTPPPSTALRTGRRA